MQKNKTGTELQGQGREVYFQVIFPGNAEQLGLLFAGNSTASETQAVSAESGRL